MLLAITVLLAHREEGLDDESQVSATRPRPHLGDDVIETKHSPIFENKTAAQIEQASLIPNFPIPTLNFNSELSYGRAALPTRHCAFSQILTAAATVLLHFKKYLLVI